MNEYDGNAIYADLNSKIAAGKSLDDKDILNLLFLPLMRNTIPRRELAETSVKMAKAIPDHTKREACIVSAFALASNYLQENEKLKLLEVLRMDMLEMAFTEHAEKIARSMLLDRVTDEFVARHTGLDVETVRKLRDEMEDAPALATAR